MKKLSASLLLFILVSIIALGWLLDLLFEHYLSDADSGPIAEYEQVGRQLAGLLDEDQAVEQLIASWNQQGANKAEIMDAIDLPLPDELWLPLKQGELLVLEGEQGITLYFWLPKSKQILAFTPFVLQGRETFSYVNLLLTTGFYLAILALLLLWLLPLVKSLRRLRKNAIDYGRGDFTARIPLGQFTYIGEIETAFNRMAEQIETLVNDNKLISSAVSHDLRTPLARLRFGIDLLSETESETERQKYQEHLSNDIDEMQSLVEALLNYAKLEQMLIQLEKKPVNISALLSAYQQSHPEGLVLLEIEAQLCALGDETYVRMLLHNILNNALNYGQGHILVVANNANEKLRIEINDDGQGIAPEQRAELFKPFVRGERANSHGGYGMGLAIAERIATWHGGSISVGQSTRLSGALFVIELPQA